MGGGAWLAGSRRRGAPTGYARGTLTLRAARCRRGRRRTGCAGRLAEPAMDTWALGGQPGDGATVGGTRTANPADPSRPASGAAGSAGAATTARSALADRAVGVHRRAARGGT